MNRYILFLVLIGFVQGFLLPSYITNFQNTFRIPKGTISQRNVDIDGNHKENSSSGLKLIQHSTIFHSKLDSTASDKGDETNFDEKEGPVNSCRKKIGDTLSPEELIVTSAHDDPNGSHIAVKVVSSAFEGKNRVKRQQMVYKAIWDEMQGPIHAVDQLICKTPDENVNSPQNLGEY